ncbi:MAG: hypothetical protein ACJAW3_000754 [Lentimonas sp.]|jgi:hypothetical protein
MQAMHIRENLQAIIMLIMWMSLRLFCKNGTTGKLKADYSQLLKLLKPLRITGKELLDGR